MGKALLLEVLQAGRPPAQKADAGIVQRQRLVFAAVLDRKSVV